jgi:uncharacterized membrane-anchored protein YitT (DUF2179 family)
VFIITDKPVEVSQAVMDRLNLGITSWPAQGMFTESRHTFLFCTVSRSDVNTLRRTILSADPDAFVVIGHGHQAIGGVIRRVNPNDLPQELSPVEEENSPKSLSPGAK